MPLRVTHLADAPLTSPPGHHHVQPLQLQGGPDTPTTDIVVLLSHYLPGAYAEPETMTSETVYLVVAGELVVAAGQDETTLQLYDSVHLSTGTTRSLYNRSALPTSIVVIRSRHGS